MTAVVAVKTCPHCGEKMPLSGFYTNGKLVSGEPKYASWCKKCIKIKQASYHARTWGSQKLQYVAHKRTKTVRNYLAYLRQKAHKRNKSDVMISLDALETLWFSQKGQCALTKWPMTMELGKGVVPTNCSIDRIDSYMGYVPGNVQLVCRAANIAKSNLSASDFLALCKAVVATHGL